MNIIIIGFMGVGKTTIGRKLAARLGYQFVDTDRQIEFEQCLRIADIFESKGEAHFRQLETSLLKRLKNVENTVIATGGGFLKTPGNIELMKEIGPSVHLRARIEDIFERVSRNKNRPLLQTEDPFQTVKRLYEERKKLYQCADITIDTGTSKMWPIVTKIIQEL